MHHQERLDEQTSNFWLEVNFCLITITPILLLLIIIIISSSKERLIYWIRVVSM